MIVLGIDPAISYRKPFACVTLRDAGGRAELLRHAPATKIGYKSNYLLRVLYVLFVVAYEVGRCRPDLVAVEFTWSQNRKAFPLQAISYLVRDMCKLFGIPCVMVNAQSVKRYGRTKQAIEQNIPLYVAGAERLPPGDDWYDACAIALAGNCAAEQAGACEWRAKNA